jgi:hypothetical protein
MHSHSGGLLGTIILTIHSWDLRALTRLWPVLVGSCYHVVLASLSRGLLIVHSIGLPRTINSFSSLFAWLVVHSIGLPRTLDDIFSHGLLSVLPTPTDSSSISRGPLSIPIGLHGLLFSLIRSSGPCGIHHYRGSSFTWLTPMDFRFVCLFSSAAHVAPVGPPRRDSLIYSSSQKHSMFRTLVILADLLSTLALAALLQAQLLGPSI